MQLRYSVQHEPTIDTSILQQLKFQFFKNWANKVIFRQQSYLIHFSIFLVQIFKMDPQICCTYNFVAKFSLLVLESILSGKSWNLVGYFRNLSAIFNCRLNSKIFIDTHVCNKLLRYPENLTQKYWNMSEISLFINFFGFNCCRINTSIVSSYWTQLWKI